MQGPSHSLSDHRAIHLALFAFVCVLMVFLSGSSPTPLAGTDWLTRQIDNSVEQFEAPNQTAVPTASLEIRLAEGLHDQVVDLLEPADDDESKHCLQVVRRLNLAPFGSQMGLRESSADRALSPFRLRAFSSRGSPSA